MAIDREHQHQGDIPLVAPPDLRLRGERPRVTRLSRKVLIGLGAVSALSVAGALGYALQTGNKQQTGQELLSPQNRPSAEGLAGLPKDYTGLPRPAPPLGPPLPGDLGKPILNAGAAPNTMADVRPRDAAQIPGNRSGAGEPPLCPNCSATAECWSNDPECLSRDLDDSGRDTAGRCRVCPEHAGSQDRLPHCCDRQAHGQSGPARIQGLTLRRAGGHRDSGCAHHGHSFRSSRPSHCSDHGSRLGQPVRQISSDPQGRS